MIKLVARFYDPTAGAVRVDGVAVDDYDQVAFHQQLGVVPQEAFLFSGTIRDNIAYGRDEATDAEVEAAARAVGAHDFIASLPGGYLQWVSERGRSLSSGQRQLIALARAHLVDPAILLLDEATSNLDLQTEAKVQAAMGVAAHGRTTILIAHRLQTARLADRIVVIDDGRVVEDGSHDELLAPRRATRACGRPPKASPPPPVNAATASSAHSGERLASAHAGDACDEPGRTWWRDGVLYQIYPRSYMDTNGDGVGDLRGITARLDHLQWLGVDGIWLDPIMVSPNDDWGYDVADYFDVDPALGTLADADDADRGGGASAASACILDLVPNHTSDQHPWFVDAKSSPRLAAPRLVRVGRSRSPTARCPNNWTMAFDPRPARVDVRRGERPVLPQPVPAVAARSQLVERRRARRVRRHPALLVRPRRRRLPHRRVPLGHQGPRAARQPARHHGRPLVRADDGAALASTTRAGPEVHDVLRRWRKLADELRPAAGAHRRDVRARARGVRDRSTATATS